MSIATKPIINFYIFFRDNISKCLAKSAEIHNFAVISETDVCKNWIKLYKKNINFQMFCSYSMFTGVWKIFDRVFLILP